MSNSPLTYVFHSVAQERIDEILQRMPDEEINREVADTFKILGNLTRIKLLYLLSQEELCVHDLSTALGISQSAVSHQLKILRAMRLVKNRREGRSVYYSLDDDHVINLFEQCLDHATHRHS
ncbi:MAG: ArsR/SmtB family transcription factor [Candidatus Bipolaricaulia bacterium]